VEFPAFQKKCGLVRNGDWGQASIPIGDIRDRYIDLRMLSYPFVILEEQGTAASFAMDDIHYFSGVTPADSDQDGVEDNQDICVAVANVSQRDTDIDGIGIACDADLTQD
jgi:hypothetical protein